MKVLKITILLILLLCFVKMSKEKFLTKQQQQQKILRGADNRDCAEQSLRVHVGNYDSVQKCGEAAKSKDCSDTFFYAPKKGWCKCESKEGKCTLKNSPDYNRYRLESTQQQQQTLQDVKLNSLDEECGSRYRKPETAIECKAAAEKAGLVWGQNYNNDKNWAHGCFEHPLYKKVYFNNRPGATTGAMVNEGDGAKKLCELETVSIASKQQQQQQQQKKCWIKMPTGCGKNLRETNNPGVWFVDPSNKGTACEGSRKTAFNKFCSKSDAMNYWGASPPASKQEQQQQKVVQQVGGAQTPQQQQQQRQEAPNAGASAEYCVPVKRYRDMEGTEQDSDYNIWKTRCTSLGVGPSCAETKEWPVGSGGRCEIEALPSSTDGPTIVDGVAAAAAAALAEQQQQQRRRQEAAAAAALAAEEVSKKQQQQLLVQQQQQRQKQRQLLAKQQQQRQLLAVAAAASKKLQQQLQQQQQQSTQQIVSQDQQKVGQQQQIDLQNEQNQDIKPVDSCDNIRQKCCNIAETHGFIPTKTWGTVGEPEKKFAINNNCDTVVGGSGLTKCPYTCDGKPQITQLPEVLQQQSQVQQKKPDIPQVVQQIMDQQQQMQVLTSQQQIQPQMQQQMQQQIQQQKQQQLQQIQQIQQDQEQILQDIAPENIPQFTSDVGVNSINSYLNQVDINQKQQNILGLQNNNQTNIRKVKYLEEITQKFSNNIHIFKWIIRVLCVFIICLLSYKILKKNI